MGRKCQACGAEKDQVLFPNMSMFRFPKEEGRCRQWINNAGLNYLLETVPIESFQNMRLCPRHFTDDQFVNHYKNSLNWFAVPTLFNSEEIGRPKVRGALPPPSVEPETNIPYTRSRKNKAAALIENQRSANTVPSTISNVVPLVSNTAAPITPNVVPPTLSSQEITTMLNNRSRNRSRLELTDALRLLNMFKSSKVYCKSPRVPGMLTEADSTSVTASGDPVETIPCRVCGERNWDMVSIFDTEGYRLQLLDKIHLHLPIRVEPGDVASLKLCRSCVDKLQGFHVMYERCAQLIGSAGIKEQEQVPVIPDPELDPVKDEIMEGVEEDPSLIRPPPINSIYPIIEPSQVGEGTTGTMI